jgi:hypothetical protein
MPGGYQAAPGGYQVAQGYAYGQPYVAPGYPAQAAYPVQQAYPGQTMPGQQPFPGQTAAAAYAAPAMQTEIPAPLVSTGASSPSAARMARSKSSSAALLVVGLLIVGVLAAGGGLYYMQPNLAEVAAGGAAGNSATGSDNASVKPNPAVKPSAGGRGERPRRDKNAAQRRPATRRPKVAPVKSSAADDKLFNDDPDSAPDAAAMPADSPENSAPRPDAATERKPAMSKPDVKTPSADSPTVTPEEKAAVGEALVAARRALAERNLAEAEDQLAQATLEATAPELLAEIDRLQFLSRYVGDFWNAVRQHMAKLESATTITVDGEELSIIESSEQKVIFRVAGKRREYTFEKLPPKLAYWLAENWLDKSNPAAFMTLGAYQAVAPQGDRKLARQLFEQAAAEGLDVRMLLAELDAEGEGK